MALPRCSPCRVYSSQGRVCCALSSFPPHIPRQRLPSWRPFRFPGRPSCCRFFLRQAFLPVQSLRQSGALSQHFQRGMVAASQTSPCPLRSIGSPAGLLRQNCPFVHPFRYPLFIRFFLILSVGFPATALSFCPVTSS